MRPAVAAALLGALCAGCGSGTASAVPEVRVVQVAGPGRVLADGAGAVLYAYVPDDRGPSRCTAACAAEWPPLVLPEGARRAVAGPGVDAALLGSDRRADGARQVTYGGWPLYGYVRDAPGVVTGQGSAMGAWYLVSPRGTLDTVPVATTAGS